MGCYIDPKDMTKEQWLAINATGLATHGPGEITSTHVPVCLVHNGDFTAAGVAYDEVELHRFNNPNDPRPKIWFQVERTLVRQVSDLEAYEAHLTPCPR